MSDFEAMIHLKTHLAGEPFVSQRSQQSNPASGFRSDKAPSAEQNLDITRRKLAEVAYDKFLNSSSQGFFRLLDRPQLWTSAEDLAQKMRSEFEVLVVVGIGGSSLGFEVFHDFFQISNVKIIDNVDPLTFQRTLQNLNLHKTAWAFISKSGTTIETLTTLECVLDIYESQSPLENVSQNASLQTSRSAQAKGDLKWWHKNFVIITENKKSTLLDFAVDHKLAHLEVPLDVGGRFSVFSPVGLFPLFFSGISKDEIQRGFRAALDNHSLVVNLMNQFLASFERQEWISCLWFYSSHSRALGQWFCQLWAESLAKKTDRKGELAPRVSTPVWLKGACDQHSVLQQLMEGSKDKFILFIDFLDLEHRAPQIQNPRFSETESLRGLSMGKLLLVESEATRKALTLSGVSTAHLTLDQGNVAHLTELMMVFMLMVGGLGEALNINAFDQPGVELGKVIAKEILASTNG